MQVAIGAFKKVLAVLFGRRSMPTLGAFMPDAFGRFLLVDGRRFNAFLQAFEPTHIVDLRFTFVAKKLIVNGLAIESYC